jgi:methyltransferase (TIGR00027 family)
MVEYRNRSLWRALVSESHEPVHSEGPSITARRVAAQRLSFERLATDYGDPGADERLARDVSNGIDATNSPLRRYLEARTRFFDQVVVDSIADGITQIVVGAAGYDGRAWRYSKPQVAWFEVDHPSTQVDKLRRLERLTIDIDHVRFVPADFAQDPLAPPLLAEGLDPVVPTLVLLEGVAVYLDRSTLESVLRQLRGLSARGSRLAVSLSVSGESSGARERRRQFQAAVARMGEPARSAVEPDQVEELLSPTGWRSRAMRSADDTAETRRLASGLVLAEPR